MRKVGHEPMYVLESNRSVQYQREPTFSLPLLQYACGEWIIPVVCGSVNTVPSRMREICMPYMENCVPASSPYKIASYQRS